MTLPGFPPTATQEQFVGLSAERALEQAFAFYGLAQRALSEHATPLQLGDRVLDFGCGWGRIMRCFLREAAPVDLFGVDSMPAAIELCRTFGALANVMLIRDMPPTPLRPLTFKLIYAYSVFSHLSAATADTWIQEFASLLMPGGLLVVTTRGLWFLDYLEQMTARPAGELSDVERTVLGRLRDIPALRAQYQAGRHVFVDMGEATAGLDAARYGEDFVPERYVRDVWSRWLEFVCFEELPAGLDQAVIVMRRVPRD